MKKYTFNKHLHLLILGCLLFMRFNQAQAQVDKAIKYAYYFDYERAEKFLMSHSNELNDTMVLQLAEALYLQGKYPQALYYYKIADKSGIIQTANARRNYVYASTMMREKSPYYKKTNYFKNNYFLYTVIDTFQGNSANEDFAAFYWKELLFVTTSRTTSSNNKNFGDVYNKQPYLDIYPFTEKGTRIPYPSYLPKSINSKKHDGPIAISQDTNLIVLSRNYTHENSKSIQNLSLVYFIRNERGNWSPARLVNFCKPGFSAQHPFYNEADKTLYFSSDMPGGSGGFDLYKTNWNGSEWTPPINLGEDVNSEYDEVFPSITLDGELMYASNHIETTGGLDIVLFSNGNRYLLNEPFNSIYDDFGVMFKNKKEGYFSSNRFSNKFDDNIYHFTLSEPEKQSLFVKVFDANSKEELDQAKVSFSNEDGTYTGELSTSFGSNNIVIKDTADARKTMHIFASKDGYLNYDQTNNVYIIKDGKLIKEIYLVHNPIFAGDNQYLIENNQRSIKLSSILENDSLNGVLVKESDISIHIISNPLEGYLNLDSKDGEIKVAAGATAGTYKFNYAICSVTAPSLCDTAQVTIVIRSVAIAENQNKGETNETVPMASAYKPRLNNKPSLPIVAGIVAKDDNGFTTTNGGYLLNVRNNDKIDGKKATQRNTLIRNEKSDNPNITLNRKTGVITVKKGIEPGTYQVSYDLMERGNRDQFGQANVSIVVRTADQIPGRIAKNSTLLKTENTVIYFHNDEPRPIQLYRPAFTYQNSFDSYMKQMEEFYKRSSDSKVGLDTFFIRNVEGGYDNLNQILEIVQEQLNKGVQVEISVSAYCSPIASTEYNNKLSSRRIVSVTRYLKKWNDGALWDAIESNRITFWEHSLGELEAPKDISSDYAQLDLSVFGIRASKERRVSITVKIVGSNR